MSIQAIMLDAVLARLDDLYESHHGQISYLYALDLLEVSLTHAHGLALLFNPRICFTVPLDLGSDPHQPLPFNHHHVQIWLTCPW